MLERKYLSREVPKTMRVFLLQDPTVEVFVKTNEVRVGITLKGIHQAIAYQTTPRWSAFAGHREGNKQRNEPGWVWEFV